MATVKELQAKLDSAKSKGNKSQVEQLQAKISALKQSQKAAKAPATPAKATTSSGNTVKDLQAKKQAAASKGNTSQVKQLTNKIQTLKQHPANAVTTPPAQTAPPVTTAPPVVSTPQQGNLAAGSINPGTGQDAVSLQRVKDLLGAGEGYGRRLADEFYADGSLGRMNVALTPEEQAAMELAKNFAGSVGNQTGQVSDLLNTQRSILDESRQLSPLELEALGIARGGLGGLASPEMEALRSSARGNIQGALQAEARNMAKLQARNQVFGAAATAQRGLLGQAGVRETRNLERDLLVKNIEIKQAAARDFANLSTATEGNRASRTNASSGLLANTVLGDEQQRNTSKNNAVANQGTLSNKLGDSLRGLEQYNLGQRAAEKAGQVSSIIGGIGTITGQRGLLAGEDFARDQFNQQQDISAQILDMIKNSLGKQKAIL